MVSIIRAQFPGKPVAVIYGGGIDRNSVDQFDWVGFDCYTQGHFSCGDRYYNQVYAELKAFLKPAQGIILVPQVGLPVSKDGCCINDLIGENKRFYALAYGDPQVIGMFSFIWESFSDPKEPWYGLSHYSQLQPEVKTISRYILGNWTYPVGISPVYRFDGESYGRELFFTLSLLEGILKPPASYSFDGIGFSVYTNPGTGLHALYRCYDHGSEPFVHPAHFISNDSKCEGAEPDGLTVGYASNSQTSGTTPLYRFTNRSIGFYLETIDRSEGEKEHLFLEGILGYVPIVEIP